nr:retrotransposon protein, putative, Ty1-copia subclass [Tanacetum cinerariifolium]
MTTSSNNSVFKGFFEKQKLTGPNFIDWYRQLRIVLSIEDKLNYLEQPILRAPIVHAGQHVAPEILADHTAWIKGSKDIEEWQSVSSYVLKMKGYIDNLERLGHPMTLGLGVSLILIGLRKEFDGFVQNYNMHRLGKIINELLAMLKLHEQTLPKNNAPALHVIRAGKVQKAELLKKKKNAASGADGSGIFVIELNTILNRSWIYDTGCDGFVNRFLNNTIQVSRNNMVYFSAIPRDGIFEIDLSNSHTNESSIYVVSNKRAKLDLDSALLWHCRLRHISKKRIEKLQHDGLLDSSDLRAFEKCVSCMYGKMARKPYTHQMERAKDLLGLIHTDVCGLFKIMSRQGASYFITFIDNFSRYGYVYLLKHKHEVFETFKVFQKEVENQLGKTIKSLRSDREGEYMSQEFLDHLKDHGIIAHRTLPHTPQHNGYPKETMRYSFYYPPENKVLVARNAEFLENSLINQEKSGSLEDLELIQEEYMHPSIDTSLNHEEDDLEIDEPQSDIIPIRRSTRTRHAPDRMCLYIDAEEHELGDLDNEVWVLVELPLNGKTVGSKWLFKKKTDIDGNVHTYKARLMAKGYTQTSGIDYEETFSPVADIRAIRILIAIVAYYDYEIWHMDVKTAFLNGYLNEEVYMEQPEGFVNKKYPNRVCKLKRSIYGLKQASRQWNKRFDDEIKKIGFTQNCDEPCVYLKASGSNITFLILYVDHILIMGNNIPMLQSVKSYLGRCFAMKDLGEAAYILRINIYRDRSRRLIGLC